MAFSYEKVLADYLATGQEVYLREVADFSRSLMKRGIGPETMVEIHLAALKAISNERRAYPRKVIDASFAFLMQGITAYGVAYKEYLSSKTEGYLAEIKELNQRLSEKLAELAALHQTARTSGFSLDLNELLSSVFQNAVETLMASNGSLMLLEREEGVLTIEKAYGLDQKIIAQTQVRPGEGIAGLVFQTGKPVNIRGASINSQATGKAKYEGVNSICAPLKTNKGVVGVINLNRSPGRDPFTEGDLDLLCSLAQKSASAIENAHLYEDLRHGYLVTIRALATALELKDPYTRGHSDAVARYAVALAKRLGLPSLEIEGIEVAAILHDIGKIGIHEDILKKPGKLTAEERRQIEQHPEYSLKILEGVDFPWDIKSIIYAHHERWDGTGYPNDLCREEIPVGARILALADFYDAMTSDRVYRRGLEKAAVIQELRKVAGTQLDPEMAQVFIEVLGNGI